MLKISPLNKKTSLVQETKPEITIDPTFLVAPIQPSLTKPES